MTWDLATRAMAVMAFLISLLTFARQRRQQNLQNFYAVNTKFKDLIGPFEYIHTLADKPYESWSEHDKKVGYDICASLHETGMLMRWGYVDARKFVRLWYYSLPRALTIVEPIVADYRARRDDRYWGGIRVLERLAAKHVKTFKGFR